MRRTWILVLGLSSGLVASCFDAPSADVMFSCDPASAPACPDGYTCEADGCCHRDGSDASANAGMCKTIGTDGGTDATTLLTTESSGSGTDTSSDTGTSTDTGSSSTGSSTGATTDESGTTSTDATSTGDDASNSGAGSTDSGSSSSSG